MPTIEVIPTKLQKILTPFNTLASTLFVDPPHDFSSLRDYIIAQEIQTESAKLRTLIKQRGLTLAGLKKGFLLLCEHRALKNNGTALSFTALPNGDTNRLYWEIAAFLFSPHTLAELLSILSPNTKKMLTTSLETEWLHPALAHSPSWEKIAAMRKIRLDVCEGGVDEESNELIPNDLSGYLFFKDTLFDVGNIKKLPFERQAQLYEALELKYPGLHDLLYTHNSTLSALREHIVLVKNKGQTLRAALTQMAKGLLLGGQKMRGEGYAGASATTAYVVFNQYVASLSEPLKDKAMLLKSMTGKTLFTVLSDLNQGKCVETAGAQITNILNNPQNKDTLDVLPALTREQLRNITNKYSRKNQITFHAAEEGNTHLPEAILSNALNEITIKNAEDLVSLLVRFPLHLVDALLSKITIEGNNYVKKDLLQDFMAAIKHGFFNKTQLNILIPALTKNITRFVDKKDALFIVIRAENTPLAQAVVNSMNEKERMSALKGKDTLGRSLLYLAAVTHESLTLILTLHTIDERLKALTKIERDSMSVIHMAAREPECLKVILALLPRHTHLNAVKAKDNHGRTVLFWATRNTESLKMILALYPVDARFDAVNETDNTGSNVLHWSAKNPESLKILLVLYASEERVKAVNAKNRDGLSVFDHAANTSGSLKVILELYPVDARLDVITKKDRSGWSVFSRALDTPESVNVIFSLLPEIDRFRLLKLSIGGGMRLWQDIFTDSPTDVNQTLWGIESPLIQLLSDINYVNNDINVTRTCFFYTPSNVSKDTLSLRNLFTLSSPTEIYPYVLKTLSTENNANKQCLNKLVSTQGGDISTPYAEKLKVLKNAWLSLGLITKGILKGKQRQIA